MHTFGSSFWARHYWNLFPDNIVKIMNVFFSSLWQCRHDCNYLPKVVLLFRSMVCTILHNLSFCSSLRILYNNLLLFSSFSIFSFNIKFVSKRCVWQTSTSLWGDKKSKICWCLRKKHDHYHCKRLHNYFLLMSTNSVLNKYGSIMF